MQSVVSPDQGIGEFPDTGETDLIQTLYRSLTSKEGFHPFLKQLSSIINARASGLAVIRKHPIRIEHLWHNGLSNEFIHWYLNNNVIEHDVILNQAIKQAPGEFQTVSSLKDEAKTDSIYQRWKQQNAMLDAAWLVAHSGDCFAVVLILQRTCQQGVYTDQERAWLNRLAPFIRQAVQLYQQTNQRAELTTSLLGVINAIPNACFVLNSQANVLFYNTVARSVLRQQNGLLIQDKRLVFKNNHEHQQFLQHTIESIRSSMGQQDFRSSTLFVTRDNLPSVIISITPIEDCSLPNGGALVTLYDPTIRRLPTAAMIAKYFSLSPAEALLCEDLITGLSLKQIACLRHKSEATLRTYLKTIFAKTNQSRQGQLISTILSALMY